MKEENTSLLLRDKAMKEVSEEEIAEEDLPGIHAFFLEIAGLAQFTFRFFGQLFRPPFEWRESLKQSYRAGNRSLALVSITGFIMGLVLTVQSRPTLADFGAESLLPGMVAISIVREIGPVITALICAGKIGSGIGAELGAMRVTEQIDAMEVSGTYPFKYLVSTRVLSAVFMVPLLVIFADAVAFLGCWAGVNLTHRVGFSFFFSAIFDSLHFRDVLPAFIKSILFGLTIGLVACYKGYNTGTGTESVGKAANAAVVIASLLVFVIDMLAVQVTALFSTH